jgi:hypothetical protein
LVECFACIDVLDEINLTSVRGVLAEARASSQRQDQKREATSANTRCLCSRLLHLDVSQSASKCY